MKKDVTVTIATIPPRATMLARATQSVATQSHLPEMIITQWDHLRVGAATTKNLAIEKATTTWVAPLDDDDEFMPQHLEVLLRYAEELDADVVYSVPHIPQIPGHRDPDGRYFQDFNPDELLRRSYIQTTSLIRRELLREAGGFQLPWMVVDATDHRRNYDDWGLWLQMLKLGAKFVHAPEVTFIWNHWGYGTPGNPGNTSGDPSRW